MYLLEKLLIKDMFPSSIISTKEGKLFSIQKEEHGRALRFLKVEKEFFDSIDDATETIEVDLSKVISIIKNVPAETELLVSTKGNKLSISGRDVDINISYKEPEGEVLQKLPIEFKEGVPHVGKSKVALTDKFFIKQESFKAISSYSGSLKTEFYKFLFDNGKIKVRVGDLHDTSDYAVLKLNGDISTGEDLEVIFTYGMPQISDTFDSDVHVFAKTSNPAWFYESGKNHLLGILIPPYEPE